MKIILDKEQTKIQFLEVLSNFGEENKALVKGKILRLKGNTSNSTLKNKIDKTNVDIVISGK